MASPIASGHNPVHRRPSAMASSPASTSSAHLNGVNAHPARRASGPNGHRDDEDEGLVMRDRERDNHDSSTGKAGGVGVGVTKPKRRLSRVSAQATPPHSPNTSSHAHNTYQPLHSYSSGQTVSAPSLHSLYRPSLAGAKTEEKSIMAGTKDAPTLFGIELKWISLITLALQNAFLTIIMHYSRISVAPRQAYSAASAVLMNELLKGSISLFIALKRIDNNMIASPPVLSEKDSKDIDKRPTPSATSMIHPTRLRVLAKSVLSPDCFKLAIPAILYVIQNNLQYVAASNLDVATFQVTYQMKILTTAFFSVLLLRKRLSKGKWLALLMLAVGVGIVQIQTSSTSSSSSHAPTIQKGNASLRSEIPSLETAEPPARAMHPFTGFLAVTLACMTSGLAGVYFELILKSSSGSSPPPDLWIRNTQLSLFSLIPALIPVIWAPAGINGGTWLERLMNSFSNFNGWAIGTVLTQTFGGLITAVVIRYSDNIMKGFATSLSIIISFLASVALFSYPITVAFLLGSTIVLFATYLYNSPASADTSPPPRTQVAVEPGSPIPQSAPILGETPRPSRTSSVISLLGLAAGTVTNGATSRQPSMHDLRSNASSFTLGLPPHSGPNGFYSASAPGTPYLSSAYPSSTNLANARRDSPNVNHVNPLWANGGADRNEMLRSASGSPSKSQAARPSLTLDTDSVSMSRVGSIHGSEAGGKVGK